MFKQFKKKTITLSLINLLIAFSCSYTLMRLMTNNTPDITKETTEYYEFAFYDEFHSQNAISNVNYEERVEYASRSSIKRLGIVPPEDFEPPVVTLNGVQNGQSTSSPVTVTFFDESGISYARYLYNNGNYSYFSSGRVFTAVGSYIIEVADTMNNIAYRSFTIIASTPTPPTVLLSGFDENEPQSYNDNPITVTYSDLNGISSATYSINNGVDTSFISGVTFLDPGDYQIMVTDTQGYSTECSFRIVPTNANPQGIYGYMRLITSITYNINSLEVNYETKALWDYLPQDIYRRGSFLSISFGTDDFSYTNESFLFSHVYNYTDEISYSDPTFPNEFYNGSSEGSLVLERGVSLFNDWDPISRSVIEITSFGLPSNYSVLEGWKTTYRNYTSAEFVFSVDLVAIDELPNYLVFLSTCGIERSSDDFNEMFWSAASMFGDLILSVIEVSLTSGFLFTLLITVLATIELGGQEPIVVSASISKEV